MGWVVIICELNHSVLQMSMLRITVDLFSPREAEGCQVRGK